MSNDSKVLALKYRPQNFDDLIGQDVVVETITNSIIADKVPNAYLFTGIRGVGKTTIARIVAKSLNCPNVIEKKCKGKCDNCNAIANSNHIDVLEMDAASRTGIDDVRELIEFSRYGPTSSKYKIFIIDEVHMLSKQAFNALLKTLEEPPEYLKFIFATTEVKKIPVTVISRCQRFDLSRIRSSELFNYIKKIKNKEGGKITDEALKLIVKISEGSVRDALSLLDRALLTLNPKTEFDLKSAQKIFGFFDKSQLIDLFEFILKGDEIKVIEIYRKIYDQGVEPKIFINDFLELLYYFKNIESLTLESTNFSLNDREFQKIKDLNKNLDQSVLILFWQFTISTLDELTIVSNQHLSMEMFLLRLMHLSSIKLGKNTDINSASENPVIDKEINNQSKPINQIKNIYQEEKSKPEIHKEVKSEKKILINSLEKLVQTCLDRKEIKLKYELEKNVNLVRFEKNMIEISFNENLDKNFVKELSSKLFDWTGERWIISFSQLKGEFSMKEKKQKIKKSLIDEAKNSKIYKDVIKNFPDAELIDINLKEEDEPND
ncbi:DNA polymerase III subunit gamma/tau [Candidatus Pelagibacter sp.]|uniref:DNA polymerase III subunit gamma/tau n=1 Tax=Candidatus Pelagibacter sp. TaxID=2024849 RepID=UPI003F8567EA